HGYPAKAFGRCHGGQWLDAASEENVLRFRRSRLPDTESTGCGHRADQRRSRVARDRLRGSSGADHARHRPARVLRTWKLPSDTAPPVPTPCAARIIRAAAGAVRHSTPWLDPHESARPVPVPARSAAPSGPDLPVSYPGSVVVCLRPEPG